MANDTRRGPFARTAPEYLRNEWDPLPCEGKELLVRGVTGRHGRAVTMEDVGRWIRRYPDANIALRLPRNIIGVDIDVYHGATETLNKELWQLDGLLLPRDGLSVTSRTDGSGIWLFRVPDGTELRGKVGQGIDVIQWFHRYVMVPPSIHPDTGMEYRASCAGSVKVSQPWCASEFYKNKLIPDLPQEWIEFLSRPARDTGKVVAPAAAREWWKRAAGGPMCDLMEEASIRAVVQVAQADASGGLHDEMCRATWELVHYAAEGHRGLGQAIRQVQIVFTGSHRKRPLLAEWKRALVNACCDAAAREQDREDPCDELAGWSG